MNTGLNRSSTSPAKMSQMVRSRSHDTDKESKSRDMKLSLQNSERRVSDRFSDVTPTHDPHNPRFVFSLSHCFNLALMDRRFFLPLLSVDQFTLAKVPVVD